MQIRETLQTIQNEISGEEAYAFAEGICAYNRVQLSEGYDEAATYCANKLQKAGVTSRILTIPMEKGTRLWSQEGFDNWTCRRGMLRLTSPDEKILCDAEKMPTSLIQRSCSASLRSVPIILLDRGSDPGAYSDLDLRGALVFAPGAPYTDYRWATAERGAAGILTDYLPATFTRDRSTLPDARSYFNFFWKKDEKPCFGFVLTPRQGDALRALCRSMEDAWREKGGPRYPLCDVEIQTETAPGCAHLMEAEIPGKSGEEIVITAHLCHAKPSANDNASGCAGAMEIMAALQRLLSAGRLPSPKHGIRMLLVPEVSGTFAYLATHEERIGRMKAAINLDMIGRRQEGRSGLLGIWATPDALPSFVIDLMAYVRRLSDREAPTFNIDGHVSPFHSEIMEYNGGSDHYVYCDPTVGVPCITFMQWLDQNYHTSSDVQENLDPEMLKKSASMAACWVYALANPDLRDLPHAFSHMRERFQAVLHTGKERDLPRGISYGAFCDYETTVFRRAAEDALRFYGEEAEDLVEEQCRALQILCDLEKPKEGDENPAQAPEEETDLRVPKRNFRGPLSFVGESLDTRAEREIEKLGERYPGLYGYHSVHQLILFRVNGKRTVSEIARLVGMESRYYSEGYVSGYLDILARCGVISFVNS